MSHIAQLTLTAFRNYTQLRVEAEALPIVLIGPNGAGKTNLLEAISLLAPGRGLRGARLSEMAQANAAVPWAVAAQVETNAGTRTLGTGQAATPETRLIRVDGVNRAQAALAGIAGILWLTPAMDRLFTEPAAVRRRFLDRIVYGYDAAHAARVARYEQACRERQKLLEDARHPAWLDGIETVIAETGIAIAAARLATTARLDQACAADPDGAFPQPALALAGEVETWLGAGPALAAEDRLREGLARNRGLDAAAGRMTLAAHRCDLLARYREKDIPAALASTGEQKALLIAVILAHAGLMRAERGQKPILLLDEITAHLDAGRRAALFERVAAGGLQAWMSGTDADDFAALNGRAQWLRVENGDVLANFSF